MIFVTVGTQLPFDRLIEAIDRQAPYLKFPVIAQTGASAYRAQNIETHAFLEPSRIEEHAKQSKLIIAHAGIGSVLLARRLGKSIVIVPRSAALGEHRNDHQSATASRLEGKPGVFIAKGAEDLPTLVQEALHISSSHNTVPEQLGSLQSAVTYFVLMGRLPSSG